ncbi:AIM24 family protein, partial [Mycobacterium tuberculosis]|nr:AIM24 family protein [Mycobacterium tuberculosis]
DQHGGRLICQKDSFLAGARGVQIGVQFQRRIMTGLFGGEGFIMQKLEGDGWVFIHAGGCVIERELAAGERLDVDTGCVV